MYNLTDFSVRDIPTPTASLEEITAKWKSWVSIETQRRTVLGLYIVDGQDARFAGAAPYGKHLSNPIKLPGNDRCFRAKSANEWALQMRSCWTPCTTVRTAFVSLFQADTTCGPLESQLSVSLVLEGFQAIVSERNEADCAVLGSPPIDHVLDAILRFQETHLTSLSSETLEHLLRWHTLCLDLATDTVLLGWQLCTDAAIEQQIFSLGRGSLPSTDLDAWACTTDARRAVLHAIAIERIANSLTATRAYATHFPAAIFAAATVYCAFSQHAHPIVTSPEHVAWRAIWTKVGDEDKGIKRDVSAVDPLRTSHSYQYMMGEQLAHGKTRVCNLRYSLLNLRVVLRKISLQWGVANEMLDVLSAWTAGSV